MDLKIVVPFSVRLPQGAVMTGAAMKRLNVPDLPFPITIAVPICGVTVKAQTGSMEWSEKDGLVLVCQPRVIDLQKRDNSVPDCEEQLELGAAFWGHKSAPSLEAQGWQVDRRPPTWS